MFQRSDFGKIVCPKCGSTDNIHRINPLKSHVLYHYLHAIACNRCGFTLFDNCSEDMNTEYSQTFKQTCNYFEIGDVTVFAQDGRNRYIIGELYNLSVGETKLFRGICSIGRSGEDEWWIETTYNGIKREYVNKEFITNCFVTLCTRR